METGNNFTPRDWIFFPEADSFSKDQVVIVIGKSDGVDFLICNESDNRPLGSVISIDFQDFKIWYDKHHSKFSRCLLFGEERFGAWYPEDWVNNDLDWLKPIDPNGKNWNSLKINFGIELYFRFPAELPDTIDFYPMMAQNANRWLKNGKESVRVHKNGNRMEIAVIKKNKLDIHTIFNVKTSSEAAYNCLLVYDQSGVHTEHTPLIWEGQMDEIAWAKLRPFIKKIDTSYSHPWSALSVLNN